ncbi:hypothetical protein [Paenibacillus humicus]|uniref:hypothetical protein n=1 Tax=Paenibacillus humicus TaxID=412861 RepID=UPI001C3FE988|nr:hypothetical protein [Paenibacillus humicus]
MPHRSFVCEKNTKSALSCWDEERLTRGATQFGRLKDPTLFGSAVTGGPANLGERNSLGENASELDSHHRHGDGMHLNQYSGNAVLAQLDSIFLNGMNGTGLSLTPYVIKPLKLLY